MFKTKITEMLGTKYPILMGGMQWLAKADFVASVSEAGGLAFLTSAMFPDPEDLLTEVKKTKQLTDKPFGLNISMLPNLVANEKTNDYLSIAISEKIPVIETSGRNPVELVGRAKAAGIKIIHKVPGPKYAVSAQAAGVDAVSIVGYEAGGHPGRNKVGTFLNLPLTVQAVDIPVIAAGGICNGQTFAAALALGAEGVLMGTRFVATKEAPVHKDIKDWIVNAKETDTMITQASIGNDLRCIRNNYAHMVLGYEKEGAKLNDLMPLIKGEIVRKAWDSGNIDGALFSLGQVIGLINDIPTIKELLDRMAEEAEAVLEAINCKRR